ncbi:hypothetical protein QUW03_07735 [Faecalicoccus acidiformans]|uniref:hypothetical protein n=1 Tax=Faecalicoccus acidiformans TaxID=915173 RepID=UPI0025A49E7C|nr:hypothetical protein [Faecalicoccus acidiformans]MDM8204258.1 hypothetical protein [Faecalicoccus acidiformans]
MSLIQKSGGTEKKLLVDDNVKKLNRNFSGYGLNDCVYLIYDRLLEREETPTLTLEGSKKVHLFFEEKDNSYDISSREIVANPNGYIRISGFSQWNNYTFNGYFECDVYANYES